MNKKRVCIGILILTLIMTSCVRHWKDGGTVTYDLGVCKIIKWNTLEGKNYTETHFFPMSLFSLNYFNHREEKDFEELLESAIPQGPEQPYEMLHTLNTYPSSGNKYYDAYVKRGPKVNYYLIERMLCDEPTNFFIPDIASPLTDGDIAFILLTDINCKDNWEEKLFPHYVLEKEGYTSRYLFDYLHASKSNRIDVAKKLLEQYIENESDKIIWNLNYEANRKFEDLKWAFKRVEPLIENEVDKKKLSDAVGIIMGLSKRERSDPDINWHYDTYTDGRAKLNVVETDGGGYPKGAGGHIVRATFYLRTEDSYINFFLTDDEFNLVVDIGGGGDREGKYYVEQGGNELLDYEPNRFYEFSTKKSLVKIRDFYWD